MSIIFIIMSLHMFALSVESQGNESKASLSQKDVKADDGSGKMPAFSWDKVPLYLHIRKNEAFTSGELKLIAKYPLVTFEKTTGMKTFGGSEKGTLSAAQSVKALNPNIKILYYWNVFIYWANFYEEQDNIKSIKNAFLKNSKDGSKKIVRGRLPAYDLTKKTVRDWWVNHCKEMTEHSAIDGLFFDANIKVLYDRYAKGALGKKKKEKLVEAYKIMMNDARGAVDENKLVVANIIRALLPASGLEYMNYFDGSYIEGFFPNAPSPTYEEYVIKGMDAVIKAAQSGKIIAFSPGFKRALTSKNAKGNITLDDVDRRAKSKKEELYKMRMSLAIFLICAEKYSYFNCHAYSAEEKPLDDRWYPEYDKPLGAPKGPAVKNGYVYTREFKYASVWVDIKNQKSRITWHGEQTK
ncbi:hypothetical protein LNTAR_25255 [Lentisphaera araneosa HTCC2155]|uniref:Uncharacterized protein n=1 Tax=Lentisphaera araneosa HTCC2155 TaxID=313628 RepID=A6DS93_9BACT|nr:putative glycoside hydrolase [Lentisphaera araneosa]EDM25438.1 hypothetical protein LNTAR_25255 [Lentisphaera araneosa HTCC2155]